MPTKLTSRRAAWSILLGVGIVTLLALGITASSDAACSSCHVMKNHSEALAMSPHTAATCSDCHAHDVEARLGLANRVIWGMLPRWAFGADSVSSPPKAIPSGACLDCHDAIFEATTEIRGMRILHGACVSDKSTCDSCHTAATHGEATRWPRQPVMEQCVDCHVSGGVSIECDVCHQGKLKTDRLRQGPWAVTHGKEWQDNHGAGTLTACRTCHPPNYCVDCHGLELPHPVSFGGTHGVASRQPGQSCESCHDRDAFCNNCHGIEMPHPGAFLSKHPDTTQGYGDPVCISCHKSSDCDDCHVKHTHPGNTQGTLGGEL